MKPWIFIQNPFYNSTVKKYRKASIMSSYHDAALYENIADPFFETLYNFYHPLHVAFENAYVATKTHGSLRQGETLNFNRLVKLLAHTKIRQWDVAIQNKYPQGTPEYMNMLPDRRKPFQSGVKMKRVSAVHVLELTSAAFESLADITADINEFYLKIDKAWNLQQGNKTLNKDKSSILKSAHEAMSIGQYKNLGALMQKYGDDPREIQAYFDLNLIRDSRQSLFTGHVNAGSVHTIVKHTFKETDEITLTNEGNSQLKFYLASAKNLDPDELCITLDHGEQTVRPGELGFLKHKYLTVFNPDPLLKGEFKVEFV